MPPTLKKSIEKKLQSSIVYHNHSSVWLKCYLKRSSFYYCTCKRLFYASKRGGNNFVDFFIFSHILFESTKYVFFRQNWVSTKKHQ